MEIKIKYLERVDSTNDYARKLIRRNPASEGMMICSGEQYAGRGQGSNTWSSEPGKNLTFSLIISPVYLVPEQQFMLSKVFTLALFDHLVRVLGKTVDVSIKWPNDIYANHRKIAGILIENLIMGNKINWSILGAGINFNQEEFPEEIPGAVSVKQLTGKNFDLNEELNILCIVLSDLDLLLKCKESEVICRRYDRALYGLDLEKRFYTGGKEFSGKITGVDDLGRLLVMTSDHTRRSFQHGEISML